MTGLILGPEVVSLPQMKDALQTGLVDAGNVLPLYFPADMEVTGIAGDLALIGRNPHAMAMAMTEYGMTCEPCQEEFKKLGMSSDDVTWLIDRLKAEIGRKTEAIKTSWEPPFQHVARVLKNKAWESWQQPAKKATEFYL